MVWTEPEGPDSAAECTGKGAIATPNRIRYQVTLKHHAPVSGEHPVADGAMHIAKELPEDEILSCEASLSVPFGPDDRVFMNGYQSWTYCPEYDRSGFTRGIRLRGPLRESLGLESYGDYAFVSYPEREGITHGVSYCYFRSGDRFRLAASLDENPGYTLFRYDTASHELRIRRDCAGLRCGGQYPLFDLFFAEGSETEVFDAWFAAMGVKPRTLEKLAGYSSWYNRYQKISADTIREDLNGCIGRLQPGDLFQIDDGWEPRVGDWLEADGRKFPAGMKAAADAIHAAGFRAGLWLAPFAAQKGSRICREHPDWLLRDGKGKPWFAGVTWGGFYALDLDRPAVIAYLEKVFDRVLNDWGYNLVKLDFLYAAAPFGSADETRAARMRRALELLRRLCGDRLILGCGVPLMPAFGLVDYCRIGCDVGLDWDDKPYMRLVNRERVSTRHSIGNTIFRRQLSGRAWLNDPDVFFLRERNLKLTQEQKHVLATVNSVLGGVLLHSDNMAHYDAAARAQYARLLQNREAENIRVEDADGLTLRYELGGREYRVKIE